MTDSLAYNKTITWFEATNSEAGTLEKAPKKCAYCGTNMKASCKSHSINCPYYCGNEVPVGNEILPMILLALGYLLVKFLRHNIR